MFASQCDRIIEKGRRQEVFGQLYFSLQDSDFLHLSTYLDLMSLDPMALDRDPIVLSPDPMALSLDPMALDRDPI
jgi:hypothetical protein